MVPLISGFCGGFVAAYLAFKHEWPAVSILIFSTLGFAAMYGLGVFVAAHGTPSAFVADFASQS